MKQSCKATSLLLLWECLKNVLLYWFVFCLVDYVHHGHYSWSNDLILAAILGPIIPLLRRCFLERNGGTRKAKYSE